MRSLDEALLQSLEQQRRDPHGAHVGIVPENLTYFCRLRPFQTVPEPERNAGGWRVLAALLEEARRYGRTGRLLQPGDRPAAVYYAGTSEFVHPVEPIWSDPAAAAAPLPEIPLPTWEHHLYALLPDGRLRVFAHRSDQGVRLTRDETYYPGGWPAPCKVADELRRLFEVADPVAAAGVERQLVEFGRVQGQIRRGEG